MFRAERRSSSGALTVFGASGLHTHVVTGRSQVWVGTRFPVRLDSAQPSQRPATINVCKTRSCNYSFWAPDDGRLFRPKHVEQLRNTGRINSTTGLHLVGSFYEIYITMPGSKNITDFILFSDFCVDIFVVVRLEWGLEKKNRLFWTVEWMAVRYSNCIPHKYKTQDLPLR
jgi:hypothetical protein